MMNTNQNTKRKPDAMNAAFYVRNADTTEVVGVLYGYEIPEGFPMNEVEALLVNPFDKAQELPCSVYRWKFLIVEDDREGEELLYDFDLLFHSRNELQRAAKVIGNTAEVFNESEEVVFPVSERTFEDYIPVWVSLE